jgi:nicotinamidase-related amidase
MVDFAVVPERTALVNVDMQNCFVQGYPSSAPDGLAVLDRINRLGARTQLRVNESDMQPGTLG